jgi:hypothetical protein
VKADVEIAVRFVAGLVDDAGYRDARVQDLEPTGMVDVLPESLITLCGDCLRGCDACGGLRSTRQPVSEEGARHANNQQ